MPCVQKEPRLSKPPRIRVAPIGADCTEGDRAVQLAHGYIVDLYDWQEDIQRCWFAEDPSGRYACPTCGVLIPRQNGKTKGCIASRMFYGAAMKGEKIRYSAHRVDTTLEMFDIFVELFGDPHKPSDEWPYPELNKLVDKFTFNNGHQKITLKNGGSLRFVARSTGAGRGSTVDVNIYDEAQFLTDEQLSAALPAQSAAPSKNPQVIYAGTPPSELAATGEVFGRVRKNAIDGAGGISWHEWSVGELGDVSDRSRWFETNPSLGLSLLESQVEAEMLNMAPDTFAIERMCLWPEKLSLKAINDEKWAESATSADGGKDGKPLAPPDGEIAKLAAGVKFAPDGGRVCVAIAAMLKGDKALPSVHVELVFDESTFGGLDGIMEWCADRSDRLALVAVDGKAGGQDFCDNVRSMGMPKRAVHLMTSSEVVSAATKVVNSLNEGRLTHHPDKILDGSATGAEKRKIGTDGYGFGGESLPIEAAAAAVWAVTTTKRNPGQGDMIG